MEEETRYMSLKRYGTQEAKHINEKGTVHVFPKLDGTSARIFSEEGVVRFGSRKRILEVENDNAGFMNTMMNDERVRDFFEDNQHLILYGEWLVPHTVKHYEDSAWRKFYVYDVYNRATGSFMKYETYVEILKDYGFDYIPLITRLPASSVTQDSLVSMCDPNGDHFLVKEGNSPEGLVVKNYEAQKNVYGRFCWMKYISDDFASTRKELFGEVSKKPQLNVEETLVVKSLTEDVLAKERSKIVAENGGWENRYIPVLMSAVFHSLIVDDLPSYLVKHKMPTINFMAVKKLSDARVREYLGL